MGWLGLGGTKQKDYYKMCIVPRDKIERLESFLLDGVSLLHTIYSHLL